MKPVIFHDEATAELDEAVAYYEQQKPGLGLDLLSVVEEATLRIRQNPQLGARYKNTRFRHVLVRRFPYLLFYADYEDIIWIAAVAHGRRRPGYWRGRARD